eukprot:g2615.t1
MALKADEKLHQLLWTKFHLKEFRPLQLEAIQSILRGEDTLLVLATGGGKSLTYQLPPLMKDHSFTVVVSPLIALARDQVMSCGDRGIYAELLNNETSVLERDQIEEEILSPSASLKLLYTTPETLQKGTLIASLEIAASQGTLLCFAVDEAHCISSWGHDFRPSYRQLGSLRDKFSSIPFIALTVKYKELIKSGTDDDVLQDLLEFLHGNRGAHGIIYARLRETCEWLADQLSDKDIDVAFYHAGMSSASRKSVLESWLDNSVEVIVATVAFGMGIDKSNVRWVIHWNVPSSLEGFYQESGRAGRDGLPSISRVYLAQKDLRQIKQLEKGVRRGAIHVVASVLMDSTCRRHGVLQYFGEKKSCCNRDEFCDYCEDPVQVEQSLIALKPHINPEFHTSRSHQPTQALSKKRSRLGFKSPVII